MDTLVSGFNALCANVLGARAGTDDPAPQPTPAKGAQPFAFFRVIPEELEPAHPGHCTGLDFRALEAEAERERMDEGSA
jgi:hypothetical protein